MMKNRKITPQGHDPAAPVVPQAAESVDTKICLTWCWDNSNDGDACKLLCLDLKENNHGLYHRALRRAEKDGLQEPHRHIFAAGAVWAWLTLTGFVRPEKKNE